MKKILFLMCISTIGYAQTEELDKLLALPKMYSFEQVPSTTGKSYNVTDQSTLTTKRVDVNKRSNNLYEDNETVLYRRKTNVDDPYDHVKWTTTPKKVKKY
jgi:hypothetical protein